MKRHIIGRLGRLAGFVVPATAAVVIGFQVRTGAAPRAAAGAAPAAKPGVTAGAVTEAMFAPGLKFHGSADCKNADCHGLPKDKPRAAPKQPGNEHTLWSGEDPHNKAYESLTNDKGKEIFTKYKALDPSAGADAATSQKCTTCHALAAPANLRGSGFNIEEGVTCGSCHGPYQKWDKPHQKEGWANAERTKVGSPGGMWTTHAFYDTKSVQARADKCTACHLAIDAKMVDAGHPQPTFELYYFSTESLYPDRHWKQEEGYFAAKLWAAGQVSALRDALYQLHDRAAAAGTPDKAIQDAYNQAMSHYMVTAALFSTNAVAGAPAANVKGLNDWAANLKANMTAKKRPEVAKAAQNAALSLVALQPALTKFEPNKATTTAVLNAIAAQDMATPLGDQGIEQQRGAVYALFASLTTSADGKPANADAVNDLIISGMYPPEGKDKIDAASFNKGLAAVRAQLPK